MARKTKKEKVLADLRRKMARLETRPEIAIPTKEIFPSTLKNFSPLSPVKNQIEPVQSSSIYIYPTQLVKKDLTKTIFLSILAISLELALFFLLEGKIKLPVIKFSLPISLNLG